MRIKNLINIKINYYSASLTIYSLFQQEKNRLYKYSYLLLEKYIYYFVYNFDHTHVNRRKKAETKKFCALYHF